MLNFVALIRSYYQVEDNIRHRQIYYTWLSFCQQRDA